MAAVKSGFYVDKTEFALHLLDHPRAALLRPPRMGKTLFISMVMALYDSAYDLVFPELFKGLFVATEAGQRPCFNQFYVLRICLPGSGGGNFSRIATEHIQAGLTQFYRLHPDMEQHIRREAWRERGHGVWWELQVLGGHLNQRLMVLVDEIDRAVMGDGCASVRDNGGSSSGGESSSGTVGGGGGGGPDSGAAAFNSSRGTPLVWLKRFFSLLKQLGDSRVRYYVTGIFPLQTASSVFNGKDDLTHSPLLAHAFGLTAADVRHALARVQGLSDERQREALDHIRRDANGLHPFNSKEPLFNPQLVQVALRQLLDHGRLESTVVDVNQLLTQSQLTRVLHSTETAAKLFSGATFRADISRTVSPEVTMDPATLLFYLGVVSPREPVKVNDADALTANLQIPNRATRMQFVDEFIKRTQGQLGSAKRFLEEPTAATLRLFLKRATSMRWSSRQTEDDLKALFFAEILHFTNYAPAAEHSYGGGRTDISAQVHDQGGNITLIIVELKTLGALRGSQSLLKRASDSFGFKWTKHEEVVYSAAARAAMDQSAPSEADLLPLEVTYTNSGISYGTVRDVHQSAISQVEKYRQSAIETGKFHNVVAFAVTQVVHRFVVSGSDGDDRRVGGGGGGGGAPAVGGGAGAGRGKKKKTKKKKK
jgi:hypothetical protein